MKNMKNKINKLGHAEWTHHPIGITKKRWVSSLVMALCLVYSIVGFNSTGHSQILVQDAFNGTDGDTINGRTPDTINTLGVTWTGTTQAASDTTSIPSIQAAAASTKFDGSAYFSTSGISSTANLINLSADIELNNLAGNPFDGTGVGLGFWSSPLPTNGLESFANFGGLLLANSGGVYSLNLLENTGSTVNVKDSVTVTGVNSSSFYNLSYQLNKTTGALTKVVFNGVDYTSSFSGETYFKGSNLKDVGFYGSNATSVAETAYLDNFILSVPEPSSYVQLVIFSGLLLVGGLIRRRILPLKQWNT